MRINIRKNNDLINFIRTRRKLLKISQKDLADLTGLSVSGIAKLERGDSSISVTNLIKMSPHLGFKLELDVEDMP
jgi:transcriptional regulator with XRE-family HTH domain